MLVISLVVLAGWIFGLRSLQSIFPISVNMKANSAACAMLCAVALLRRDHRDHVVYAAGAFVAAALTLVEYFWGVNLGIDEILFRDPLFFRFPGRMSQYTGAGFVLAGLSLLLVRSRNWMLRELSRGFALLASALGTLALVSHLYDTHMPDRISPQANVSVPTALSFVLACIGVHYANPGEGLVRLLHARNEGGAALRRLAPAGLFLSLALGLAVRDAQRAYRWEVGFSLALVAAGTAVCLMTIVVLTAASLEREDLARRDSEQRFRLAANTAPVMIWMTDTDKGCVYVNEPWLRFVGRSLESQLGDGWLAALHPEDQDATMSSFVSCFERREPFQTFYRLLRQDGEYRWILDTGVARFTDGKFDGYVGSCVDVTDRRNAEDALANLERKLLDAQEEERSRIARELHDDIVQRIAMLTFQLRSLAPKAAADLKTRTSFDTIADQLRRLGTDIQSISHRLHSSHLEFLGLASAASVLCKELCTQKQVEIDLQCDGIPANLSKGIALSLYRVLQEALQNAMKYSGTKVFKVVLEGCGREVRLMVSDGGVGFDPHRADKQQGLGLISMRERIRMVHGEFELESAPGRGTVVRCTVPLGHAPVKETVEQAERTA
jgi:PAS domain S-box-containing protein